MKLQALCLHHFLLFISIVNGERFSNHKTLNEASLHCIGLGLFPDTGYIKLWTFDRDICTFHRHHRPSAAGCCGELKFDSLPQLSIQVSRLTCFIKRQTGVEVCGLPPNLQGCRETLNWKHNHPAQPPKLRLSRAPTVTTKQHHDAESKTRAEQKRGS